jgi:phage/plasmid-like protein (TIGR03299 family)
MFYAGDVPWHGLGTHVEEAVTWEEAVRLAKADWDAETEIIFTADGEVIPGWLATVRATDGKPLGIVSERYKIVQYRDAASYLDSLIQDRVLRFETAGVLRDGAAFWALARMDEDLRIQDDVWAQYMLTVTSHDRSHGFQIHATQVRVVCANTLLAATRGAPSLSIRHIGDVDAKLRAARKAFSVTTAEQRRMHEWLEDLTKVEVGEDELVAVREEMFGTLDDATPTRRRNAVDRFLAIYNAERERCGPNAYALANAVTGYADHGMTTKAGTEKLAAVISGAPAILKASGLAVVGKIAGTML